MSRNNQKPMSWREGARRAYAAGVYEQTDAGWGLVTWSTHSRADLAQAAARRYARGKAPPTGGAYTWSAWYGPANASDVRQVTEVMRSEVAS